MIGHESNDTLGVRERIVRDGKEVGDVRPVNGLVEPGTGGMSVSPSAHDLPPHLIPKRLRTKGYPAARRGNSLPETFPWHMGDGAFAAAPLCPDLLLRIDPHDPAHGLVEPDRAMTLEQLRAAVAATRSSWIVEEW
jgi:hypothetical protein